LIENKKSLNWVTDFNHISVVCANFSPIKIQYSLTSSKYDCQFGGVNIKKIAFLFLIYDLITNEDVWNLFFQHVDPNKYVIHIHYKTQKELKWFEKNKLKNCIPTNYIIDTTIAKAHNILIGEALKDPHVYKTINLSQSCIPFKPFEYVYDFLTKDNNSHFNMMPMTNWSISVTGPAIKFLKRDEIHKAANWFILNRNHANCCIEHNEYLTYFENVHSPEEFLYMTMFKKHCPNDMLCTNYSAEGATTFTNWAPQDSGMVYKYPCNSSIKNYSEISKEEVDYLLHSPCLFGRKFNSNCAVDGVPLASFEPYVQSIRSL
jgi:hypothetical protein